ncbi:Putative aliphatic sulfonates transport permease protein SsuC [Arthrobacter ulcerisalmonis]|uniref:Aliphatic sulfonates transport permease protein SsuC n=1 Tax=Arthrobacter ulcerisalmonis TaxID=2483813 RepID=A0A3P5WCU3_9MICC|nr:ABC transporter permease [Arthrobacter ulcerisalmonis]VDC18227.1 Putative aliphatic sulfonates transport permease protein SsuC [Arthrobacter ulcerisalmonis]
MSAPTLTQTSHPTAQNPVGDTAGGPVSPQPQGVPSPLRRALTVSGRGLWRAGAILLFLLVWEFGPLYLAPASTRVFLPPLHEVLGALGTLIAKGQLQNHLAASLGRSASGFGIAVLSAVLLGLLVAWYGALDRFLNPLLEVFRNTAALALLPVFTLLLGIGETSKISIVAYAAFFPVLLNTIAGVRTVDPLLIRAARSLGLSNVTLFQKVILPSAVPTIFTGIRMAGTSSILVLIAAEMVGAKAGLGYLIVNSQSSFLIPDMYAGILTVSLLGLLVNYLLVGVERHFSRWRTAVGTGT